MIRALILAVLLPGALWAQSREVRPGELSLSVTVEETAETPYRQEMVLITIHGQFRRHITRERLVQPDLSGFNWMQLGEDQWFETRINGQKVKNFRRRMALFPEAAGTLEIAPFVHRLTLTDEGNDWFEHEIRSEPVRIEVRPLPEHQGWWFPTRRLQVSDTWSNPPDQLDDADGVLRVIRLEAVGAAPEMLPPMPELASPSAMIFAHPERRFVELSPVGPVAVAFWRWTIRPTNGTSAILEPITFDYFDTVTRRMQTVRISPQRVAIAESATPPVVAPPPETRPRRALSLGSFAVTLTLALGLLLWGRRLDPRAVLARVPALDPMRREVRRAGRAGDAQRLRRAGAALARRAGRVPESLPEIRTLDAAIFGRAVVPDFAALSRQLVETLSKTDDPADRRSMVID